MESSGENNLPERNPNRDAVRTALRIQRSSIIMLVPPGQEPDRGRGIIMAATGSVLNPTIKSRRRTHTYEGSYMIRKLRGYFSCSGDGGFRRGKLMTVLRDANGNDIQGLPVGLLIADSPVEVYIRYLSAHPELVPRPISMYSAEFGPSGF